MPLHQPPLQAVTVVQRSTVRLAASAEQVMLMVVPPPLLVRQVGPVVAVVAVIGLAGHQAGAVTAGRVPTGHKLSVAKKPARVVAVVAVVLTLMPPAATGVMAGSTAVVVAVSDIRPVAVMPPAATEPTVSSF
jgi:hypothetical protein